MIRPISISVLLLLFSCDAVTTNLDSTEEEPEQETYFQRGEYGGSSLLDKEDIYNITFSNDGERVAMIRRRNPKNLSEPTKQLWITDKYGRNPQYVASGIGTVSWSNDDSQLAVTYSIGTQYMFIIILDLIEMTSHQITGAPDQKIYKQTTSNAEFLAGDDSLLVTVWGKQYQQDYDIGMYIIEYKNNIVYGPIGEYLIAGKTGNYGEYFSSYYDSFVSSVRNRSFVIFNFETEEKKYINPHIEGSEFRLDAATPNPRGNDIILTVRRDNADQLVNTTSEMEQFELLTELGGHNPRWMPDGKLLFIRDIHKGQGAHNVPHRYDMETGEISKLWEHLPGYVPEFPPISHFNPIPIHVDW